MAQMKSYVCLPINRSLESLLNHEMVWDQCSCAVSLCLLSVDIN